MRTAGITNREETGSATIGLTGSISAATATLLFAVSLVVGVIARSSLGAIAGYIVCIVLAGSVIVMMAMVYLRSREGERGAGLLALCAALIYGPFVMAVYFTQLAVVLPNPLDLTSDVLGLVTFTAGSPAFALDMLGYAFLCLATLAAAFTLNDPKDKALRVLCIIHGALALPTLAAPLMSGLFGSASSQSNDTGSYVLLVWCAIFAPIAFLFARHFQRRVAR